MTRTVFLILIAIFLSTQAIGLYTAWQYIGYVEAGIIPEAIANPADPGNAVVLFGYIIAMTAVVILIIKFVKRALVALEGITVFFASMIVFDLALPYVLFDFISIGTILAALLTVWKLAKPTILSQDVALVFSVAGAGAILGSSLELLPITIFMVILATYDFLSVFWTKHMVYMAKAITERPMAFTASIPARFAKPTKVKSLQTGKTKLASVHIFQLGGGDIAIPLMFASSALRYYGIVPAVGAACGGLAALLLLFLNVSRKPGRALPALPPIVAGAMLGFLAGFVLQRSIII